MNLRKLFAAMAGVTAATVLAGTAGAVGTFSTTGNSTVWTAQAAWTSTGSPAHVYPSTGDTVNLNHNVTASGTEACRKITIASSAILTITGSLTLDASVGHTDASTVNGGVEINGGAFVVGSGTYVIVNGNNLGYIKMFGDTPLLTVDGADGVTLDNSGDGSTTYASIQVDSDLAMEGAAVINGSGSVKSEAVTNRLEINLSQAFSDVQLTLDTATIYGAAKFMAGPGGGGVYLDNEGTIRPDSSADSSNRIVMDSTVALSDVASSSCANADWFIPAGGILEFRADASLLGDFYLAGTARFYNDADVTTSGDLNLVSGGCIDVDAGGSFGFNTTCGGGGSPPSNPVTADYCR